MCCIGTFARHTVVHEDSCIPFERDISFEVASLLSCGVVTGWGSAVRTGGVQPGDTVAVVGVGGLGSNAVQGARLAGARNIVAIDPVEFKREKAGEFGATHTATSLARRPRSRHRDHRRPHVQRGGDDDGRRRRLADRRRDGDHRQVRHRRRHQRSPAAARQRSTSASPI